ncbi:uncharacterized protein F4822DRAFT_430688 [Hypoxylon trugodes]|uniref:uncharacterized protein n=1 Tax=Hypoxylon trugodes TaxID=326681 RepID=UPI00219B25C1|nr:uncharacterized protein F4822DRAFT_430688 [Hypoxylon trugodes]KAI1387938.1 hypothetical protein F4822DRAFT_430688 [Hypoxylon trugodes]
MAPIEENTPKKDNTLTVVDVKDIKPLVEDIVRDAFKAEKNKNNSEESSEKDEVVSEDEKDKEAIKDAPKESSRSIRQFRAAWKSVVFPKDMEKVFEDEVNTKTDDASPPTPPAPSISLLVDDMKPEDIEDDSPSR